MLALNHKVIENIINKSKFIGLSFPVHSEIEVKQILKEIKTNYKGATHYCYAYIIDNIKRFSDNGEPSGTAGIPILNTLETNNLNHILIVVVRYFGGIKLGSGGLLRAYSNTSSMLLDNNIIELKKGFNIMITFTYPNESKIVNIIKNYQIKVKEYNEYISYEILVPQEDTESLLGELKNLIINFEKKEELFI